ncbi:MAG: YqaJ viral recombinase family protein [Bacteroidales bacterium]|nr:YqaJ viral recombinase family protein [Bacteroidales bacterium]
MALNILNKGKKKDAAPKAEVKPKPTRGERLADAARELTHLEDDRRAAESCELWFLSRGGDQYVIRTETADRIMRSTTSRSGRSSTRRTPPSPPKWRKSEKEERIMAANSYVIRPKDRAEWLEHRKAGIGSSEVATIVGLNPFETPYQLWRRKRGMDGPKEETFAMKAGHYLEDAVAQFWADETGGEIIRRSAIDWLVVSKDHPYMRVSPDRTYWPQGAKHNAENKGILECKTTQRKITNDDVPKHWFCQLQYQLGIAGLNEGYVAWLCSGREFGYQHYLFNPEFFGWLCGEVERFWVDCVEGGKEPASASAEDVAIRFPKSVGGKTVEADGDLLGSYLSLKKVREEMDGLKEKEEVLEARLKMGLGDADALEYRGETLCTWRTARDSERFDAAAFRTAYPSLAAEFTRTVPGSRRFLLK